MFFSALGLGTLVGFTFAFILLKIIDTTDVSEEWTPTSYQTQGIHSALELANKVKILCLVMTSPERHESFAKSVKNTWGKRCNILIFSSSEDDPLVPSINVVKEDKTSDWSKVKEAFRHAFQFYLHRADWFLKAQDDNFVVIENLRLLLSIYNASDPVFFGCQFKPFVHQGYMSGKAGYVMSREALRKLYDDGMNDPTLCSDADKGNEDVEMGKCLENVGVKTMDSRDIQGKWRFFPFTPEHHLSPKGIPSDSWFWDWTFHPYLKGMNCCSNTAISFHLFTSHELYEIDYLLYYVNPYGITHKFLKPPL